MQMFVEGLDEIIRRLLPLGRANEPSANNTNPHNK